MNNFLCRAFKLNLPKMDIIKKNKLAFGFAFIVGLIYIAPNVFFILSLGGAYKGIPLQVADEDFYLARIREILDGHPLIGSVSLFEYKNQPSLSPPAGEFFYALPSLMFNISPVNVLIASRFFLPFILFLLVYFLARKLTEDNNFFSPEINGIAAALFVTLGRDLFDFRSIFNYLKGMGAPGDFLIWTKPVNPVLGAIFLMSFLICLWLIIAKQEIKWRKFYITGASLSLTLMIGNYFFSWGIAASIVAALILIYLFKKEYKRAKNLIIVVVFGFFLSAPYWYGVWQARQSPWYQESLLRKGLFYTRYPLFNKIMLMTLVIYLLFIFLPFFLQAVRREKNVFHFENWHWFSIAFILGSLWVYVQQIITGMTIWPYHFAQYTISLAIIVLMAIFYNVVRKKSELLWGAGVFAVITASLSLGIYTQASVYKSLYPYYANLQGYVAILDWVNHRERDCVALVGGNDLAKRQKLSSMILSFTHCNLYDANGYFSMVPGERIHHNYMVRTLFDGVTDKNIDEYLKNPKNGAKSYLFANWKELFNIKDFPDVPNNLEEKIKKAPEDYRKFFAKDLRSKLGKYKLDYIIIEGKVEGKVEDLIKELKLVYKSGDISVYKF